MGQSPIAQPTARHPRVSPCRWRDGRRPAAAIGARNPPAERNLTLEAAPAGREAEMASRLNHPNAVGIYDIGEEADGFVYIAMEYVDGEQLSKIIERESFLREASRVAHG